MSNSLKRKVLRKKKNTTKKKMKELLTQQVSLFQSMPGACCVCGLLFDKTSKADHMSWQVNVYEESATVSLKCPGCL